MANNKQIASDVLEAVGGPDNVSFVTHCMTRLRFTLKDRTVPDAAAIKKINGVLGVQESGGQFQVIIGQNVPKVIQFARLHLQIVIHSEIRAYHGDDYSEKEHGRGCDHKHIPCYHGEYYGIIIVPGVDTAAYHYAGK